MGQLFKDSLQNVLARNFRGNLNFCYCELLALGDMLFISTATGVHSRFWRSVLYRSKADW